MGGWNQQYSLGLGDKRVRDTPEFLMSGVEHVAVEGGHTVALLRNGKFLGWGTNWPITFVSDVVPSGSQRQSRSKS
jgi:hypothetical protein